MFVEECSVSHVCQNKEKRCYVCYEQNQFKEIKYANHNQIRKTPSKKKNGMPFEEETSIRYNNYMAQRRPQSGGIFGLEGDIETVLILMECKERDEEVGGEKSISIKKSWLDKIEKEALINGKLPALIYRFKSYPDEIFYSMKYEYLLELLYRIKTLTEENELLKKKLNKLSK